MGRAAPKSTVNFFALIVSLLAKNATDPLRAQNLEVILRIFPRLSLQQEVRATARGIILVPPTGLEAGPEINHPALRRPMTQRGMLMLGDQIYADATASLFDNLTSIEKFQDRYHKLFRSPGFAKAVRAIPCYMTGDDHEFKDSWSVPDDLLNPALYAAAQQSFGTYQLSHSPFSGSLDKPPFDYSFTCGPVAVYVMDTLSNRNTKVPGEEEIVSSQQLEDFDNWLAVLGVGDYVILATGGVVAPGFELGLDSVGETDVSRAQGMENWQAFNKQRIELFDIISTSKTKILLVSGDYHCAAVASIKSKDGREIAKAVVVPPAYAPMRYSNATSGMLAPSETTGGYKIDVTTHLDGSGFAIINIANGEWDVKFETLAVADT